MKTYSDYDDISQTNSERAILSLDVVLFGGETPEDAARSLTKKTPQVTWTFSESGNGWPQINFEGPTWQLYRVRHSYRCQGNSGRVKGSKNKKPTEE